MIDGEVPVAYPFAFLKEAPALNYMIDGSPISAFLDYEIFSAFNDSYGDHQTAGSVAVFSRQIDDHILTFEAYDSGMTDVETASEWNLAGVAVTGKLEGTRLKPVIHANHFWFAWGVFKPGTLILDSAVA